LGSTRQVLDENAQLVEMTSYKWYGSHLPEYEGSADNAREKFTGKELDTEGADAENGVGGIQLSYFGARYLDHDIGQWISPDPVKQIWSGYVYIGNGINPINGVDPDGLAIIPDDFIGPLEPGDMRASDAGLSPQTYIPDIEIKGSPLTEYEFLPVTILPVAPGTKPYSIHTERRDFELRIPLVGKASAANYYKPQDATMSMPFVNTFVMQYDVTDDEHESGVQPRVISKRLWWNVGKNKIPRIHVFHKKGSEKNE